MATTFTLFYPAPAGNRVGAFGATWKAQTFTPGETHDILSVMLRIGRVGSPGTVTVSIRATSGGDPTGGDLASGTTDGDTLTTSLNGEDRTITFASAARLTAATLYAIVVRAGGDATNRVDWNYDNSGDGAYADGDLKHSANSGSTWTSPDAGDAFFQEAGHRVTSAMTSALLLAQLREMIGAEQSRR